MVYRCRIATLLLLIPVFAAMHTQASELDPGELDLGEHEGKVVYVDFWASWCAPCRAAFPWMNDMQAELGEQGLIILAVNTGDTPENRDRFLQEMPADFTIVNDPDSIIAEQFELQGMPTSILFDRTGKQIARHIGFNRDKAKAMRKEIEHLLVQASD